MSTVICTLFEGDYHYGVAALVNSLYKRGYRGKVLAGYRGQLPTWAADAQHCSIGEWESARSLDVGGCLEVLFLPLTTSAHLANYKPDFMLDALFASGDDATGIIYFDPDICVVESWSYFEEWLSCGVAVCEDINSPLPENHPSRVGWRRYLKAYRHELSFRFPEYANSGLVGVTREHLSMLYSWRDVQAAIFDEIGGLGTTKLVNGKPFRSKGFANCFFAPDQDALNATFEASRVPVSLIGREAMGFKHGSACALHALGNGKPWHRPYIREALRGNSPRRVDKVFWEDVNGPLRPYSRRNIRLKKLAIGLASLLTRLYRRSA